MSQDRELEQRLRSAIARVTVPDRAFDVRAHGSRLTQVLVGGGVIAIFVAALGVGQLLAVYRTAPAASTPNPALAALPSTITSEQAIVMVRNRGDSVGRVDRSDAKLMTLKEYLDIAGPIRVLPGDPHGVAPGGVTGFVGDPATRYLWVVAISGEVWPQPRIPVTWGNPFFATPPTKPTPDPTPYPPYRWGMFLVDATLGTTLGIGDAGIAEVWPPAFDRLPSHVVGAPVAPSPTPSLPPISARQLGPEAMSDVLRRLGANPRIDRIQYKLMTWIEFARALAPELAGTRASDAPVWVVGVSGEFPQMQAPQGPAVGTHFVLYVIDANSDNINNSVISAWTDRPGSWPSAFDALPDHPPVVERP